MQRIWVTFLSCAAMAAQSPKLVHFPTSDGGTVYADEYGSGSRAVLLVHGGRFNKESWAKQARVMKNAGFHVLSINLRGYGESTGPGQKDIFTAPLQLDVLAAVRYLRQNGAKTVSIVGGSLGGGAASRAVAEAKAGEIDRLVMLGATPDVPAEKMKGRLLFIVAKDDASGDGPRLPGIRKAFDKAPQPKELIVVDGSAHAQFLFDSDQNERVMREIMRFLAAP